MEQVISVLARVKTLVWNGPFGAFEVEPFDAGTIAVAEAAAELTSAGKLAGLLQTPIVNHPEVAILSVGRIAERPVVRDGELAVGRTGYVSLTFDHRVVDGARAAEFGLAVISRLEGS